jgi:hypothetical protein
MTVSVRFLNVRPYYSADFILFVGWDETESLGTEAVNGPCAGPG